jgi:hypothetical protein
VACRCLLWLGLVCRILPLPLPPPPPLLLLPLLPPPRCIQHACTACAAAVSALFPLSRQETRRPALALTIHAAAACPAGWVAGPICIIIFYIIQLVASR